MPRAHDHHESKRADLEATVLCNTVIWGYLVYSSAPEYQYCAIRDNRPYIINYTFGKRFFIKIVYLAFEYFLLTLDCNTLLMHSKINPLKLNIREIQRQLILFSFFHKPDVSLFFS